MGHLRLGGAAAGHAGPADPRRHRGDHEEHPGRALSRAPEGARHRHHLTVPRATPVGRHGMSEGKEELDELREAVREFLAAKSPQSAVRAAIETGYDPAVWDQMAGQLRLPGLALPGDYGGDGFGLTELEVVLEEMGAALLCSPFFATVVLAAQALLASADKAACARYLPGIAAGQTIATLAAAEGNASWDPAMVTVRAPRVKGDGEVGGGWALTGTKSFVID